MSESIENWILMREKQQKPTITMTRRAYPDVNMLDGLKNLD
jgi:hypothetical protein